MKAACEVCGAPLRASPNRVEIDGAIMVVCNILIAIHTNNLLRVISLFFSKHSKMHRTVMKITSIFCTEQQGQVMRSYLKTGKKLKHRGAKRIEHHVQ